MKNIKILKKGDKGYPQKLLKINNPPEQLYVMGNEKLLNEKSLAIIGSRNCTEYGYNHAIKFSREIAKEGICIISGMAIGIDSAAHIGAKTEIGKTIAVLASGFNHIFPKENEELFYEIIENEGCIVSEYAPDVKSKYKNFLDRNRIVSGLSDGVLVVEARYRSGTSITVKYAKQQKKNIFCIPSNVDSTTGVGTAKFIQEGAKLVLTPSDVLKEFGINIMEENNKNNKTNISIDKKYKDVYKIISRVPITINEICKKSSKSIEEVNVTLTMLELQGAIKQVGANAFIKN